MNAGFENVVLDFESKILFDFEIRALLVKLVFSFLFSKSDHLTWKTVPRPIRITIGGFVKNSIKYIFSFMVKSIIFHMKLSENRCRAGLLWLSQAVKSRISVLY